MNVSISNYTRLLTLILPCVFTLHKKSYTRRFLIIFMCTFIIYIAYKVYSQPDKHEQLDVLLSPKYIFHTNSSTYIPLINQKQKSYPLVLLWTDLFRDSYWNQPLFFNASALVSCSSTDLCQFTRNRSRLDQSSIVAFHLYDATRYQLPETNPSKDNRQSWVFVTGESPINFYYQNPSFFPRMLDNYFDQSISYKYDSPYAVFSPIIERRTASINRREENLNRISLKSKKKPVLWFVSNCNTFSQREKYVEQLKKYIPVGIYGKCGQQCPEVPNRRCQVNIDEYYFYLSFENSRCNSYITEKFWNIISDNVHRLVPIVLGAPDTDYQRIAPNQSYIHVNKFQTPKHLAEYLYDLMNHTEKYLEYLRWREFYEIDRHNSQGWNNLLCPLCRMASKSRLFPANRMNFSVWYEPKLECHAEDVQIFKQCKQANLRDWMTWVNGKQCP
ncbi:unnamed protein product [Adineta ricciae]|uniref:Fucosyltransferase n=2 Tax=Adineta ricciae TaxID=249248 RepID=A0A814GBQ3_ADIRI|nr:unnamed protein product [Adineta ricciae]